MSADLALLYAMVACQSVILAFTLTDGPFTYLRVALWALALVIGALAFGSCGFHLR